MKIVILRSVGGEEGKPADKDYLQTFDTHYAERVIGHLRGDKGFCSACGSDCVFCRESYGRCYGDDISAVIDFPAVLPHVLENPQEYVPQNVSSHDVLLVINIHEQILLEILKVCGQWGTKGVIVPLEAPGWISGSAKSEAAKICEANGIEISFPKPFCAFNPPKGGILSEFREHFHIGYPDVKLTIEDGIIKEAHVNMSAACGATYYVARWLAGRDVEDNVEIEVISKRLHSYPCTASMERDPELHDDTAMHVAGEAHYAMLIPVKKTVVATREMVMSPMGIMLQKPMPAKENLDNIANAQKMIMEELAKKSELTLEQLKGETKISPAAIHSALLILAKQGKVKMQGSTIGLSDNKS